MEKANLLYHFMVIFMALVVFAMKITAPNQIFELLLKTLGKVIPLFCMIYAVVQIFKYYGIV